jgi:hypothetical protein
MFISPQMKIPHLNIPYENCMTYHPVNIKQENKNINNVAFKLNNIT